MPAHATAPTLADLHSAFGTTLADLLSGAEHRLPLLKELLLLAEQVEGFLPDGRLCLGTRALPLTGDAWTSLAGFIGLPAGALLALDVQERAFVLSRRIALGGTQ